MERAQTARRDLGGDLIQRALALVAVHAVTALRMCP
jgi:hypothetical protein